MFWDWNYENTKYWHGRSSGVLVISSLSLAASLAWRERKTYGVWRLQGPLLFSVFHIDIVYICKKLAQSLIHTEHCRVLHWGYMSHISSKKPMRATVTGSLVLSGAGQRLPGMSARAETSGSEMFMSHIGLSNRTDWLKLSWRLTCYKLLLLFVFNYDS